MPDGNAASDSRSTPDKIVPDVDPGSHRDDKLGETRKTRKKRFELATDATDAFKHTRTQAPMRIDITDIAATESLARRLADLAAAGDVLTLAGDLGSGKTAFAGGFLRARGWRDAVPSPTFTLAQIYDTLTPPVWHLDCYRMRTPDEVFDTGWEEARTAGILLIEWPERIAPLLPPDRLELQFTHTSTARTAVVTGYGLWQQRLQPLRD